MQSSTTKRTHSYKRLPQLGIEHQGVIHYLASRQLRVAACELVTRHWQLVTASSKFFF